MSNIVPTDDKCIQHLHKATYPNRNSSTSSNSLDYGPNSMHRMIQYIKEGGPVAIQDIVSNFVVWDTNKVVVGEKKNEIKQHFYNDRCHVTNAYATRKQFINSSSSRGGVLRI